MTGEVALFGVFVPTLLLLALVAALVTLGLMRLMDRFGLYRFFAYRALVDLCLFALVLRALSLIAPHTGLVP